MAGEFIQASRRRRHISLRRRRKWPRRKKDRSAWMYPGIGVRVPIPGWTEPGRSKSWTEPTRSATWTLAFAGSEAVTVLVKRAGESRTYSMDFSALPEISGG